MSTSTLSLSETASKDLRAAVRIGAANLRSARSAIERKASLRAGKPLPSFLREELSISMGQALAVAKVALFVSRYRSEDPSIVDAVRELLGDEDSEAVEALVELSEPSSELLVLNKAERLQSDLHGHLVDCRSVVELRPVFDDDHENVVAAVTTGVLVLEFHDAEHQSQTIKLAVIPDDVDTLVETIADMKAKLERTRETFSGDVEVF